MGFRSVIIDDFYIEGVRFQPAKTNSPLAVDADAVLADPAPGELPLGRMGHAL
jgi:hypothetical protein